MPLELKDRNESFFPLGLDRVGYSFNCVPASKTHCNFNDSNT